MNRDILVQQPIYNNFTCNVFCWDTSYINVFCYKWLRWPRRLPFFSTYIFNKKTHTFSMIKLWASWFTLVAQEAHIFSIQNCKPPGSHSWLRRFTFLSIQKLWASYSLMDFAHFIWGWVDGIGVLSIPTTRQRAARAWVGSNPCSVPGGPLKFS